MKKSYIYVSSSYRKDREASVRKAQEYCDRVEQCGGIPFSPQVFLGMYMDPGEQEEYRLGEKMAEAVLKGSAVICLCDANPDERMKREIAAAEKTNIPLIPLKSLEAAAAALGTLGEESEPEEPEDKTNPVTKESEPNTDPALVDPYASIINPNWRK